jgi:hypothetical protein
MSGDADAGRYEDSVGAIEPCAGPKRFDDVRGGQARRSWPFGVPGADVLRVCWDLCDEIRQGALSFGQRSQVMIESDPMLPRAIIQRVAKWGV